VKVLAPGTPAPEFTLSRQDGTSFTRADLLGERTVLVFYPAAFSSVCSDQLALYEEVLPELAELRASIYAVSTDNRHSQSAFRAQLASSIEQLSDFEPKGATARAFGVMHEEKGYAQRALVIIGPDAVLRWSYVSPSTAEIPGANLIFDGLEEL
jgi:peroxiredoxin (alkyl hydroperoxide reductase subunit C)